MARVTALIPAPAECWLCAVPGTESAARPGWWACGPCAVTWGPVPRRRAAPRTVTYMATIALGWAEVPYLDHSAGHYPSPA